MAANGRRDKEEKNRVHQDAIFAETVRKELRLQKLHTKFFINPYRKIHVLPDKPMSRKPEQEVKIAEEYIEAIRRARLEPNKKYPMPQTESQEIGWWSSMHVPPNRNDERLDFHRICSDVTKHKESALLFTKKKTEKEESAP